MLKLLKFMEIDAKIRNMMEKCNDDNKLSPWQN